MIASPPRQSRRILAVSREKDTLALQTDYGRLLITLPSPRVFHVRHELGDIGPEIARPGIAHTACISDWTWEQNEAAVTIYSAGYSLNVDKETASIRCSRKDGTLLYCERKEESRSFRPFDVYRPVEVENTELEYVETPDGRKPVIAKVPEVFDRKLYKTQLHLAVTEDELLFGLGQGDKGDFNLRGTTQYVHQANMKIAIPVLVSGKAYGLLLNTYAPLVFTERNGTASFYCEGDTALDYYILLGSSLDEVVSGYRLVTGKASMLPKWAFGYVQSQERYETAQEMIDTVVEYRKRGIGLDCIVLDWNSWEDGKWGQKTMDPARFPDPAALTQTLHDMDAKMMMSIWPSFSEASEDYKELKLAGKMLPLNNNYNAFDEEARAIYWRQVNSGLFRHGIDAWWCDSSEPITPEWSEQLEPPPHSNYAEYLAQTTITMPCALTNAYSLYHARGIYEGQRAVTDEKRVVNLTRSSYLGQQRYGTICWSGDIAARWEVLREQIVAGLQFCVTGHPYWTLDIGAFFVKKGAAWFWNGDYQDGSDDLGYRELYTRWYQLGAFLPMFRAHGTDVRREIWHYGEPGTPFYDAMVKANRLRYTLMPTIYSYAGRVWLEDFTILRMLAFDFPDDPKAVVIKDQFMFGESMLICPITEPAQQRTVYLPKGVDWVNFETGERLSGGYEYIVAAPIDVIPVFVRQGSIIITGEAVNHADEKSESPLTINVFSGKDADFLYYDDDHDGYAYENGAYCTIRLHWDDKARRLSLSDESGELQVPTLLFRVEVDGVKCNTFDYAGKQMVALDN